MQLKKPPFIRTALSRATCTLLSGVSGAAAASGNVSSDWQTDAGVLLYSEKDRVNVVEPVIQGKTQLGEDETLNLRLVLDTMSGASPSGASVAAHNQTITSPSGSNAIVVPAGQLPLKQFADERFAVSADWDLPLNNMQKNLLGASFSQERDYTSLGVSSTLRTDFNERLTTLTTGISGNFDRVSPKVVPPALVDVASLKTMTGPSGGEDESNGRTKTSVNAVVGITQVLHRRVLTQLNYSAGVTHGYLTDPYKMVSLVDPVTGDTPTGSYITEGRPSNRVNQSLYWSGVLHLPSDVMHVSYRYYWDDWGVRSQTAELGYRLELFGSHYLRPMVRYYTQTAADFYHHSLVIGESRPAYASADSRLAAMKSMTVGMRYGFGKLQNGRFGLRVERMVQTGDSHPADAIGSQKTVNLYPGLEAWIVQLDYSFVF